MNKRMKKKKLWKQNRKSNFKNITKKWKSSWNLYIYIYINKQTNRQRLSENEATNNWAVIKWEQDDDSKTTTIYPHRLNKRLSS